MTLAGVVAESILCVVSVRNADSPRFRLLCLRNAEFSICSLLSGTRNLLVPVKLNCRATDEGQQPRDIPRQVLVGAQYAAAAGSP